jgi:lysozyme
MNTSPASAKQIAEFEGIRLSPYNDISGNATVGVGHLLHKGPLNGTEKSETEEQAVRDFESDLISRAEVFVSRIKTPLNQNQFDSLVSFCYNLGDGRLNNLVSTTGLNQGKYDLVPPEILKYNKAHVSGTLVSVPGLTRRRQWEATMFAKGNNG